MEANFSRIAAREFNECAKHVRMYCVADVRAFAFIPTEGKVIEEVRKICVPRGQYVRLVRHGEKGFGWIGRAPGEVCQ